MLHEFHEDKIRTLKISSTVKKIKRYSQAIMVATALKQSKSSKLVPYKASNA